MKAAPVQCPARLRAFPFALAGVVAALALVPASAGAFKGKVITIPGVSMLLNVACPPTVKNGKITTTRKVKSVERLNEIACTSTSFCVVVGAKVSPVTREVSQGVLLALNRGKPGPVRLARGILDLSTVVCQTAASCFAFDNNDANAVVPIQHGKPAKTIFITPHVSDAVCSKASCLGVGTVGSGQSTQGIVYRFT